MAALSLGARADAVAAAGVGDSSCDEVGVTVGNANGAEGGRSLSALELALLTPLKLATLAALKLATLSATLTALKVATLCRRSS